MLAPNDAVKDPASEPAAIPLPFVARDDRFVAETAIKLDRLAAAMKRLEREAEVTRSYVSDLMENATQTGRLQALAQSLRNAREAKLDKIQRTVADVEERLDLIQGPREVHAVLTYKCLESIDRKIIELEIRSKADRVPAGLAKLAACLSCASVLLAGGLWLLAAST